MSWINFLEDEDIVQTKYNYKKKVEKSNPFNIKIKTNKPKPEAKPEAEAESDSEPVYDLQIKKKVEIETFYKDNKYYSSSSLMDIYKDTIDRILFSRYREKDTDINFNYKPPVNKDEDEVKITNPYDIHYVVSDYNIHKVQSINTERDFKKIKFTNKYGLKFYNTLYEAHYYSRFNSKGLKTTVSDVLETETSIFIRDVNNNRHTFADCHNSTYIIDALNSNKKNIEIHEYPRYYCTPYFDLDDKKNTHYKNINDMYNDFIIFMDFVIDSLRDIKPNENAIREFDASKLVIHVDNSGINSMHILYDDEGAVFYNTAYLLQFMLFAQNIIEQFNKLNNISSADGKTDAIRRIGKVIDWGVYDKNHSMRTIGSYKYDKDTNVYRKFIKYKWSNKSDKLIKSMLQKITSKDFISKSGGSTYNLNIPYKKMKKNRHLNNPSSTAIANDISKRFEHFAPDTILYSILENLYLFNPEKGVPYICPACKTEHSSNGWYGFMKGNKGYAGCHSLVFKDKKMFPVYLFSLNAKESSKNIKEYEENTTKELIRDIIDDLKNNQINNKWSFCDYTKFCRSRKPVPLNDVIEYLYETVIHVIDCGVHRMFTKSNLNDGTIGIKAVKYVFKGHDDIDLNIIIDGKIRKTYLSKIYYENLYNYCSYDYIDFIPFLDKKDKLQSDDNFKNTFNLFQGYKHEYKKLDCPETKSEGKIKLILDHIDLLANHDKKVSDYILKWIAFIIQYPSIKNKVALAFYSKKEQSGKNIFWNFIAEDIIGEGLSRSVNSIDSLTQRFNKASEGKLFTIGNEVTSFAKNRNCEKLRSLITEILQEIEAKNFESYTIHDYNSFVFLTNNFNFMRIKVGDKRYCPCQMDESKIGDHKYFDNLAKCMKDNKTLFFNYLANLDLSNFRVTEIPMTSMKKKLIEDNISPPLKFINHLVDMDADNMYKYLGMEDDTERDDDEEKSKCIIKIHKRITKKNMYNIYKEWHQEEGEYSHKGKTEFFRELDSNGIVATKNRLPEQKGRPYHVNINFEFLEQLSNSFTK